MRNFVDTFHSLFRMEALRNAVFHRAFRKHHPPSLVYLMHLLQPELYQQLLNQWQQHRLPHAILLDGPEGAGHLQVALQFARLMLCEKAVAEVARSAPAETSEPAETSTAQAVGGAVFDGDEPCGHCEGCAMTKKWQHPDLHFVFPVIRPKSASSGTSITSDLWLSEWREMLLHTEHFDLHMWEERMGIENQQPQIFADESDLLVQKLSLTPSQGGWRVVVMWMPELMNTACANKLLKLLEEPPTRTLFLLVTYRAEAILSTILSRTQRITVRAVPEARMAHLLETQRGIAHDDALYLAHTAQGNFVRALRLLSVGHDEQEMLDMFVLLMRKCYKRDIKEMHAWSERMAAWGRERQKAFLDYALCLVRENFMMNFQRPELNYLTRAEEEFSKRFSPFINERNIIPIAEELASARRDIAQNVNAKMVFFDFALQMIVLLIP